MKIEQRKVFAVEVQGKQFLVDAEFHVYEYPGSYEDLPDSGSEITMLHSITPTPANEREEEGVLDAACSLAFEELRDYEYGSDVPVDDE